MKRSVIMTSLLSVLMLTAFSAKAADGKWDLSGNAHVRAESKNNYDFNAGAADDNKFTASRFRLNFGFNPHSDVGVFLQPQFTHAWGLRESSDTNTGATGTNLNTSGSFNDSVMDVHQAYLTYKPIDMLSFHIGRYEMKYGDGLILGSNEWNWNPRAFDGVRVHGNWSMGWADLFCTKLQDTNTGLNSSSTNGAVKRDNDMWGVYSSWNLHEYVRALDLYYVKNEDYTGARGKTNPTTRLNTYGLRVKSGYMGFDYRGEFSLQRGLTTNNVSTGSQTNTAGSVTDTVTSTATVQGVSDNQFDLEAGYTFWPELKSRFAVEYWRASKNFTEIYPEAHNQMGLADLFSRTNTKGWGFSASTDVVGSLTFGAAYRIFNRTDSSKTIYSQGGLNALRTDYGTNSTSGTIGTELDLMAGYSFNDMMSMSIGWAKFSGGDYMKNNARFTNGIHGNGGEASPSTYHVALNAKF